MALSAGTAYVDLKPRLDKGFASQIKGQLSGGLSSVAAVAGKAALAAGAGIAVGVAAGVGQSIRSFANLQQGMNEVFTLLPGISSDAMASMTDDVQGFAKEMGVLPDDVVPALYQSLSAGVPPGNVFDFLETAQKAALGGVTDLSTAVDGISSVVNAYGSDVIDATQASDLMFTAVRLGKTNFEELSASLFNVTPTASALGVEFGDVTAALAAMTAQGTPTSVATTQLRGLLVELSKDGTKASDAFKAIAGEGFQDFIAGGGNVADALAIMEQAAADNGVALQDMFGSVEAGSAALSLTGSDAFTDALEAMGESAGATDAAFDQMDQGLSRTWDRVKATVAVALTEVGERLAPFVEQAAEWFAEVLPQAIDVFMGVFETIGPIIGEIFGVLSSIFAAFRSDTEATATAGGGAMSTLGSIFQTVGEIIGQVVETVRVLLAGLAQFWEVWGGTITAIVSTVFGVVVNVISAALDIVQGIIKTVLGILTGDWSQAWDGIKLIFSGAWDAIKSILGGAVDFVLAIFRNLPGQLMGFLAGLPGRLFQLGLDLIAGLVRGLGGIAGAIKDKLTSGISSAIGGVKSFFGIRSPSIYMAREIGAPLGEGAAVGAASTAGHIGDALTGAIQSAQRQALGAVDEMDLDLLNAGTSSQILGALTATTAPTTASSRVAGTPLTGTGTGASIVLQEGAVQVNNPAPEPASTSVPREIRRLGRQYSRS